MLGTAEGHRMIGLYEPDRGRVTTTTTTTTRKRSLQAPGLSGRTKQHLPPSLLVPLPIRLLLLLGIPPRDRFAAALDLLLLRTRY